MEIKNGKQAHSHHLACLSGLSQAPLIPPTGDNGSERSTPISAQSAQVSPNKSNNQLQHQPNAPAFIAAKPPSIFFPPSPAKIASNVHTSFELFSKRSPKTPDFNMNHEHERNREISVAQIQSPRAPNAQSFSTFLPEVRPPITKPAATVRQNPSTVGPNNNWPQQDENYHLYHEPIDPDDLSPSQPLTPKSPTSMKLSTIPREHQFDIGLPPTHPRSTNLTPINTNNLNNNNHSISPKDWSFILPPSPLNKSPNSVSVQHNQSSTKQMSSSFTNRNYKDYKNDVSDDIYFCYVTHKSNERSNHRSRSYHGPKNSNCQSQTLQSPLVMQTCKNLSSTSVAELPLSPTTQSSPMIPLNARDHCIRELIETESNYVHALDMIITCFGKPLENILKRDENHLIFGHIRYFHNIHSSFQAELVKATTRNYKKDFNEQQPLSPRRIQTNTNQTSSNQPSSNPTTPTDIATFVPTSSHSSMSNSFNSLSTCFLNMRERFSKYGEYCATLSRAQELLDELTSKNETVAAHLDRCQQDANEGKFKLRDLLSLPMQRILKYHLLLAQLIKNTSSTHDDYHGLKRAYEVMVDLGQYINEVKRDTEAIQIINGIEHSITGLNMPPNTQLTDYGRLVTDGYLRIRLPNDTKTKLAHDTKIKQKRYVFVFDKVILMCKVSGVRGYHYKEALCLSEYLLDVNPITIQNELTSKQTTKEKWSHNFNLVSMNEQVTYHFYAKTNEMKDHWIDSIRKAMDNIKPAACRNNETNHEFIMHTFDKASSCDHCGKLLHGLYYQGYRCRTCFASAHKKCLTTIRPCGPNIPSKLCNTISRSRCNEPPSPSVKSNCSDDSRNAFKQHLPVSSSSTPCVDVISRNEYSNLRGRYGDIIKPTSLFPENNLHICTQRPVTSMVNVSLPSSANHLLQSESLNSYVNFVLNKHPWFCGKMERDKAQSLLENRPHGTFLVRVSPKHNDSYVISLKNNNQVKHMRIYVSKDNQLYLSQSRYFMSVVDLVLYYEKNSLVESFHMLDAHLAIPFKSN